MVSIHRRFIRKAVPARKHIRGAQGQIPFLQFIHQAGLFEPTTVEPFAISSARLSTTTHDPTHLRSSLNHHPPYLSRPTSHIPAQTIMSYYPSTAGAMTSFVQPVSRSYYPAPMTAVMPGQHYYPHMHAPMSAPIMMQQQPYGYPQMAPAMPYYQQPTVILQSAPRRSRHSRSRSRGFMGYL
jgi:hypothetical protein